MIKINRLALFLTSFAVASTIPGASAFAEMSTLNGTLLGLVRTQSLASRTRITSIEGSVESIKPDGLVIRTAAGDVRLYTTSNTPVNYKGDRYSVADLERGDVIRASVRSRGGDRDYDARSFEVLRNISEGSGVDNTVEVRPEADFITGQVVKVDDRLGTFRLDTDDDRTITVDAYGTNDFRRGQNWLYDLRSGDRVRVNGRFTNADVFKANSMKLVTRGYDNRNRPEIRSNGKSDRNDADNRDRDRKKKDKDKDDDDDDDD